MEGGGEVVEGSVKREQLDTLPLFRFLLLNLHKQPPTVVVGSGVIPHLSAAVSGEAVYRDVRS